MGSAGALTAERPPASPEAPRGADLAWIVLAIALPAVASLLAPMRMVDLAYQLRAGDAMLDTGSVLRTEIFSFVDPGAPWLNQQWLAQVLLTPPFRLGGFAALVAFRAALIGLTLAFVYLACRARGASRSAASILTIAGGVIAFPSLGLRPQLFGALCFAAALWLVGSSAARPRRAWWLVPVAALWANVHGSFALLPVLVALAALGAWLEARPAEARRLLFVGGVASLATLLTPFGLDGWRYVAELMTNPDVRTRITEWAPASLGGWEGWALLASGSALLVLLVRGRRSWADVAAAVAFFVLAWSARRNIVWWGFVAAWIAAGSIRWRGTRSGDRGALAPGLVVVAALSLAAVLLSPWIRGVRLADAPAGLSVAVLEHVPTGDRLLAPQRLASWFELAAPGRPVFVDARIETFPTAVWQDYETVTRGGPNALGVLERWEIDAVVAETGRALADRLHVEPGWIEVYRDGDGVLFVRP